MLLITTFVELRAVVGKCRTRAGRPHSVCGRLMIIHTCHAVPTPHCAGALRNRFQNGMVVALHGRGVACVDQTLCKSNGKDTIETLSGTACVDQTLCKSNGKDTIETLSGTAWQGNGLSVSWSRLGHGRGCVQ
jgi:hypothetical protein